MQINREAGAQETVYGICLVEAVIGREQRSANTQVRPRNEAAGKQHCNTDKGRSATVDHGYFVHTLIIVDTRIDA